MVRVTIELSCLLTITKVSTILVLYPIILIGDSSCDVKHGVTKEDHTKRAGDHSEAALDLSAW